MPGKVVHRAQPRRDEQPDGYTVGVNGAEPLTLNPLLFTNLPYYPDHDFMPVSLLVSIDSVFVTRSGTPGNSFPELIAYAKANPGALNHAT